MKECRFFKKQMLLATNDSSSSRRQIFGFFVLLCLFYLMNLFKPGDAFAGGYEKHTACIYCTSVIFFFGGGGTFFLFCFFPFYRKSPEKL